MIGGNELYAAAAVWGDPKFFAHKISVDDNAQPHERLAATLGREEWFWWR